jgi:hypothetical protein
MNISNEDYMKFFSTDRIDTKYKLLFTHIARTGGTYVSQNEFINPNLEMVGDNARYPVISNLLYGGHSYICKSNVKDINKEVNPVTGLIYKGYSIHGVSPPEFTKYFVKFIILRNPFDWFVSYYHQRLNAKIKDGDHYISSKGFDYMIRSIASRKFPWPNIRFLFMQAFNGDGFFAHNYVCRTETLNDDLQYLADICNETYYIEKYKQRVSKDKKDYREYYTDELVGLVNSVWGRELDLYGYSFDRKEMNKDNKFYRVIFQDIGDSVKYNYDKDILIIDGEIV